MSIESLDDFRKHYRHTYVFLEINDKKHLVSYEGDNEIDFTFSSPVYGDILVKETTAREKISFYFPKTGLYNLPAGLVDVTRNPARQWRRAPCTDNVRFVSIFSSQTGSPHGRIVFNFDTARNLFYPKYPENTLEAIKNIPDKGIAINNLLGIMKAPKKYESDLILWYRQTPVGTIDKNKQEITVKYAPLYQEICDYYTKKEPEWKIHLKN